MPIIATTSLTVKRVRGDTFPEQFSLDPMPASTSAATLEVEGLGSVVGVVNLAEETLTFPVETPIADAVAASYDFEIVITVAGKTRTVVEGTWVISERKVT